MSECVAYIYVCLCGCYEDRALLGRATTEDVVSVTTHNSVSVRAVSKELAVNTVSQ